MFKGTEMCGETLHFVNLIPLVRYVTGMEGIKKLTLKHTTALLMDVFWGSQPRELITRNKGCYSLTVPVCK